MTCLGAWLLPTLALALANKSDLLADKSYLWAEAPPCPAPPVPLAALAAHLPGSATASYSCRAPFRPLGPAKLSCRGGLWPRPTFRCCTNSALQKPTLGPDREFSGNGSQLAVDGHYRPTKSRFHCQEVDSVWAVDLGHPVHVAGLNISTHPEAEDAYALEVRVGNSTEFSDNPICWFLLKLPRGRSSVFSCSEAALTGRYVSIYSSGRKKGPGLSFCEVEVLSPASEVVSAAQCGEQPEPGVRVHRNTCTLLGGEGTKMSFEEARAFCRERGLQMMRNETAQDAVGFTFLRGEYEELSRRRRQKMYVWIGVRRRASGWAWEPAAPPGPSTRLPRAGSKAAQVERTNWGPHEPGEVGDCAVLDSSLRWSWNAIGCRISAHVGCQAPPSLCPSPPRPQASVLPAEQSGRAWAAHGDTWTLACQAGYQVQGSPLIQCNRGRWTDSQFECVRAPSTTSTTTTLQTTTTKTTTPTFPAASRAPSVAETIITNTSSLTKVSYTSTSSSFSTSSLSPSSGRAEDYRGRIMNHKVRTRNNSSNPDTSVRPVWPLKGPEESVRSQHEPEVEGGAGTPAVQRLVICAAIMFCLA